MESLKIEQFGPLQEADVKMGDITILVGSQALGKSLFVQILNLLLDYPSILKTLKNYGFTIKNSSDLLGHYLGVDMAKSWNTNSKILQDDKDLDIETLIRKRPRDIESAAFYIPAQRVLIMEEGWPRPFLSLNAYPYVVRNFSEGLRLEMERELAGAKNMFPQENRLKKVISDKIQKSIFRNSTIKLETEFKKRMVLEVNGNPDQQLPISFWSAGQREFMPLLLGLYYLCPPSRVTRKGNIQTVIIEELEMGLHPEAINSVMFAVWELVNRGYQVVISTHSLHVVELIWALEEIKNSLVDKTEKIKAFCALFNVDVKAPGVRQIAESNFAKQSKVYYFKPEEKSGQTITRDISSLDPSDGESMVSDWGGLTEFSSNIVDIIAGLHGRDAVNAET